MLVAALTPLASRVVRPGVLRGEVMLTIMVA
jgi:hypothetical protein